MEFIPRTVIAAEFVTTIQTVLVPVTDVVPRDTLSILTLELVRLTPTAVFIAAVYAVESAVASRRIRNTLTICVAMKVIECTAAVDLITRIVALELPIASLTFWNALVIVCILTLELVRTAIS
jgi:hypothetical protein